MSDRIRKKRKGLRYLGILLSCILLLGGCRAADGTMELLDQAVVLFGGEPKEVRQLREEVVETSDGEHQEYYFKQLSEPEMRVYRQIQHGVEAFQEEIYVTSGDDSVLERAYDALLRDHSELFWIHGKGTVYKTLYSTYGKFQPDYGYTREEAEEITAALEERSGEILAELSGAADYEKARRVYSEVIRSTAYQLGEQDQNIAGALYEGQAVCAGYARSVQYLLEQAGVECIYVPGDMKGSQQGHAWNIVRLDGSYYYLDATNGDQQDFLPAEADGTQRVLYDYLCPFPEEYEAICRDDGSFALPECAAVEYNSCVLDGNWYESWDPDTVRGDFLRKIEAGIPVFCAKFSSAEDYEAAKAYWIGGEEIRSIASYYMEWNGLEQVQYSYGLLDDLYTLYLMF